MIKSCIFCNEKVIYNKFFYKERQDLAERFKNILDVSLKIFTCENCQFSYCPDVSKKDLDKFYAEFYINKIERNQNRFVEFNSRFFTQVNYYINHCKLNKGLRILEVGPNQQGILPSIKIFQNKVTYFYYDQIDINSKHDDVHKLGSYYWDPHKDKLPEIDLIWMSHSLEHIHPLDLDQTIKSFYNALAKNGRIFIEIPNDIANLEFLLPHVLFFKKEGLIKLFQNHGFKVVAISSINEKNDTIEKNKPTKISDENNNSNFFLKTYLFIQKFLPDRLVKKFAFSHFVKNGPYTSLPIIRMIVEK